MSFSAYFLNMMIYAVLAYLLGYNVGLSSVPEPQGRPAALRTLVSWCQTVCAPERALDGAMGFDHDACVCEKTVVRGHIGGDRERLSFDDPKNPIQEL